MTIASESGRIVATTYFFGCLAARGRTLKAVSCRCQLQRQQRAVGCTAGLRFFRDCAPLLPFCRSRTALRRCDGTNTASLARHPLRAAVSDAVGGALRDLFPDTGDDHLPAPCITCRLARWPPTIAVLTAFVGTPNDRTRQRRYEARRPRTIPECTRPAIPSRHVASPPSRCAPSRTKLELQCERFGAHADRELAWHPRLALYYDRVQFRSAGPPVLSFHSRSDGVDEPHSPPLFERVCAELEAKAGLRPIGRRTPSGAQLSLLRWLEREVVAGQLCPSTGFCSFSLAGATRPVRAGGIADASLRARHGVGCAPTPRPLPRSVAN